MSKKVEVIVQGLPTLTPVEMAELGSYLIVAWVGSTNDTVTEAMDCLRQQTWPAIEGLLRRSFGQMTDYKMKQGYFDS
jgi:hypothetical protein